VVRRLACALVLSLLSAGCVSLTPAQQRGADDVRAFADATARAYRVPRIAVLVGDNIEGVGGTYRQGLFTITTSMLTSRHRDSIVAHELAHYLLGHDRPRSGSLALEWQREQEIRELEANAKAVEILARVRRLPEEQALSLVYDHLLSFHRLVVERRTVIPWGHRAPCLEMADLLGRFPAYGQWIAGLECAPGAPATVTASGMESGVGPPPTRDSASSGPLVHSYFTNRPPMVGTNVSTGDPGLLPRVVRGFHRSRDGQVSLFLGVRPSDTPRTIVSRWYDASGVERRTVTRRLETPAGAGPWLWQAHTVPMWELRPYPGRWQARVFVDDIAVGEYAFELAP
jgi:hypothetical protein